MTAFTRFVHRALIVTVTLLVEGYMLGVPFVYAQTATDSGSLATPSASLNPTPTASQTLEYATSSAQILPSSASTPTSTQNPFEDTWTSFVGQSSNTTQPAFTLSGDVQQSSAQQYQAPHVGSLAKHSFREDEPVSLTVANDQASGVSVVLLDPQGKQVDPGAIQKTTIGTQTTISIDPSSFLFRPGKYILKVTDSSGNTTTQDFTWGVLAINTDRSLYIPSQTADIAMAVLDNNGATVCDAAVTLTITTPGGSTTTLSTKDGSISVNSQCHSHTMSLTPDYQASYQVGSVGTYTMTLSATTASGTNSIDDSIHVVNSVPFDVQRASATRLYPYNTYPMIFHITANQDFSGSIVETAPSNFQISPFASASASSYDASTLVTPIPNMMQAFGVPSLTLAMPFAGNDPMVQGFGVALTDPIEKAFYEQFGLAGHDGLDFAMPDGTPILAAADGTVSFAGDGAYGTMVAIDSVWGRSYYGHLSSVSVKVGDKVTTGEQIGLSGHTGHVTGPHLHFGIKPLHSDMSNGFYGKVDPTPYLAALSGNSKVLGVATADMSTSQKIISWNVDLKKGDSIDIAYNYQSPPQSPAFYTLGPLKFIDHGQNTVFQEARSWQLAIDADLTAGPNNCSSGANNTGVGTVAWGTPANACTSAATTSTATSLTPTVFSNFLTAEGFGFSIPTNAVIHGIQFSVTETGTHNQGGNVVDNQIYLVKAGAIQTTGTNQATTTTWPTSAGAVTYGSTTSIPWGGTWLYSDINSSTFGLAISAKGTSSKSEAATITGQVTATITYNQPPGAPTLGTQTSVSASSEQLAMSATDPNSDTLEYRAYLYTGASASTNCSSSTTANAVQTYDQTVSGTPWDSPSGYASGATATLTTTGLTASTTYYWEAQAYDLSPGTQTFGSFSTCSNFTTSVSGPTLDQLMRHGEWFNSSGVIQPFTF